MLDFLTSFFKELNSASNKKMISLAIVLGLISGFLPAFTFLNYIIFFLVFVLRIPLGLYFASFTLFKLFSYLLDPLFNKIGYLVLTFKSLEPLFTYLYNLPFLRWSGFNNTLVIGSLIVGIIIGIVLYFILEHFIDTYRQKVFPKLKKIKFLRWIVPEEEKKGIFRLSGIVVIFVLISAFSLTVILFLDPFVKFILQNALSKTLHKKVYIKEVNTKLFDPSVEIKEMHIDSFLVNRAYLKLNPYYLLWKKFDIEKLIIDSKTNESILDIINASEKKSENKTFKLPSIKLPKLVKAEDILRKKRLKSEIAIKKLQKDYKEFESFYKSIDVNAYKKEVLKIKKEIEDLQHTKINSLKDLEDLKLKVENIKKEIKKIKSSSDNDIKKLLSYKKLLLNDIKNVKTALNEDKKDIYLQFEMIKNREFIKFSEIYLKPEVSKYVKLALNLYEKIKPYLPQKNEEKEIEKIEKSRKGIYIKFEDKIHYPDFVLELSDIKLKTSIAVYKMILKNISDNQILLNRYAFFKLKGVSEFYNLFLEAKYLRFCEFKGYAKNIRLKKIKFDKLEILHPLINSEFKGVYNKELNLFSRVWFNNVKITLNQNDDVSRIINKILNKVTKFKVDIKVLGDIKKPKVEVNSDLDKIISAELNKFYKQELLKQRERAVSILNKRINKELQKYNLNNIDKKINSLKDLNTFLKSLENRAVETVKQKAQERVKKVKDKLKHQQKKVEDKLKKQQKRLQQKMLDKLKSIF